MKHIQKLLAYLGFAKHKKSEPERVRRVSESELQRLYNESGYEERAKHGDLQERPTNNNHIKDKEALPSGCVYCASTMEALLIDGRTNEEVARLHWYENADGSYGASGKRDPKFLVLGGIEYHIHRTRPKGPATPKKHPLLRKARDFKRRRLFELKLFLGIQERPPAKKGRQ